MTGAKWCLNFLVCHCWNKWYTTVWSRNGVWTNGVPVWTSGVVENCLKILNRWFRFDNEPYTTFLTTVYLCVMWTKSSVTFQPWKIISTLLWFDIVKHQYEGTIINLNDWPFLIILDHHWPRLAIISSIINRFWPSIFISATNHIIFCQFAVDHFWLWYLFSLEQVSVVRRYARKSRRIGCRCSLADRRTSKAMPFGSKLWSHGEQCPTWLRSPGNCWMLLRSSKKTRLVTGHHQKKPCPVFLDWSWLGRRLRPSCLGCSHSAPFLERSCSLSETLA